MTLLESISGPRELKELAPDQLPVLASEIRDLLIERFREAHEQLLSPLIELRPVDLEEGGLRSRSVSELCAVSASLHRQLEAGLVHQELRSAISQYRIRDVSAFVAGVTFRELHHPIGAP